MYMYVRTYILMTSSCIIHITMNIELLGYKD